MKNVKIKNPILESVYNYYTNANNYLNESLTEDGYCITVDDRLFNDLMDMIHTGTYDEVENGHILIPTEGGYTFHITPNSELYLDDERGNELEAQIDPQKLSQLMQAIRTPQYKMVSEGNGNNAFTNVEQDPETKFIKYLKTLIFRYCTLCFFTVTLRPEKVANTIVVLFVMTIRINHHQL